MKCLSYFVFIALIVSFQPKQSDALVDTALDILHITKEVVVGVLKAWDFIEQSQSEEQVHFPLLREKEKKVMKKLRDIQLQIKNAEEQHINSAKWTVDSLKKYIQTDFQIELAMHQMNSIVNSISARDKTMQKYSLRRDGLENSTLIKFAEWTVKPGENSVYHMMETLHILSTGSKERRGGSVGLISMIENRLAEAREQVCVTQQSAQQFLYSLYSDIALTELKGYTMMQFSWMILRIYELGNFTHEAEIMHESYYERLMETQALLREAMRRADRIVWRCDPDLFIKGESYDEVTRLLQGYVENEVDMNPDGTCRENCGHYSIAKNHGCFKDLYCSKQPKCTGQLLWCQYVDSDMWICPATSKSDRRYEWIEYEDGRILGTKQNCPRGTTKVDSWWRWLFWHCSYCFCLCDEQGIKSDRYFNLRETVSDIEHNMIVTGIRFVKVNRIFHLQIQEGKLERNGIINPNTIQWKPVDDYRIYDRDVENDRDYHTLGWDRRAVDLDDLVGNITGQVVTGVRFKVLGAHLNLEIRLTEIDFAEGRLISPHSTSVWLSNDNTVYSDDKRQKLTLKSPHISTKSYLKSTFNSKHNQYIDFTNTDMDKDAAQTTVPFIDIQEVVSHPAVPLSGIGIYHKGRDGYGGFIAPRIMTFDFSPYIRIPDVRKRK